MHEIIKHDQNCFVCGFDNAEGLHVNFRFVDQKAVGEYKVSNYHQSFPGILHGGILSALLDAAMNRALIFHGKNAKTARLSVRFKKSVSQSETLFIAGEILNIRKKYAKTRAIITNTNQEVIAYSEALFIINNDISL